MEYFDMSIPDTLEDYIRIEEHNLYILCKEHRKFLGLPTNNLELINCSYQDCRLGCPYLKT